MTYTANDVRGGVTGTTFAYMIANPVGNQAPVVASPLADQWLMGGSSFSFTLPANAFVDPEGQTLTYTKAVIAGPNAASWLNFNASTRDLPPFAVPVITDKAQGQGQGALGGKRGLVHRVARRSGHGSAVSRPFVDSP